MVRGDAVEMFSPGNAQINGWSLGVQYVSVELHSCTLIRSSSGSMLLSWGSSEKLVHLLRQIWL